MLFCAIGDLRGWINLLVTHLTSQVADHILVAFSTLFLTEDPVENLGHHRIGWNRRHHPATNRIEPRGDINFLGLSVFRRT